MSDDQNDQVQTQDEEITLEKLQSDVDSAMNGWKRTAADFENYKKRSEAEKKELLEFAKEVTVVKLLPTIDTLEQALKHLPKYNLSASDALGISPQEGRAGKSSNTAEPPSPSEERCRGEVADDFAKKYQNWQMGVNGIVIQLDKVLSELGVKKIEAVPGVTKFNPNLHEAVRHIPRSKEWEGVIEQELQTGYTLNDKVIRPSMVSVYSENIVDPVARKYPLEDPGN